MPILSAGKCFDVIPDSNRFVCLLVQRPVRLPQGPTKTFSQQQKPAEKHTCPTDRHKTSAQRMSRAFTTLDCWLQKYDNLKQHLSLLRLSFQTLVSDDFSQMLPSPGILKNKGGWSQARHTCSGHIFKQV